MVMAASKSMVVAARVIVFMIIPPMCTRMNGKNRTMISPQPCFVCGPGFADLANRSEVREAFGVRCARDHAQPRQKSTGNDMHRALRLLVVLSGLAAIA